MADPTPEPIDAKAQDAGPLKSAPAGTVFTNVISPGSKWVSTGKGTLKKVKPSE